MGMVFGAAILAGGFPIIGGATLLAFYALHRKRKAREKAEDSELLNPSYFAFWASYDDYLRSDVWRAKRQEVLRRAEGRCEAPGCARAAREVHHKRYPRESTQLGNEPIEWLLALCVEHHRVEHQEVYRVNRK